MNSVHPSKPDLTVARWRTSSYSGGNNECVEVADGVAGVVPVRDSTRPEGPVVGFGLAAWDTFLETLR